MAAEPIHFEVRLESGGDHPEELDRRARELLVALRNERVESAELAQAPAPQGTKAAFGLEQLTFCSIMLSVLPEFIPSAMEQLALRVGRHKTIVRFKGRIAGQQINFEGPPAEFERLLATINALPKAPGKTS